MDSDEEAEWIEAEATAALEAEAAAAVAARRQRLTAVHLQPARGHVTTCYSRY